MATTSAKTKTAKKTRARRDHAEGIAHIKATFNNTLITITTMSGDVLYQDSAGKQGFKGSRKATPFAAQLTAEAAVKHVTEEFNMKRVEVRVSGPGGGRDSAMTSIKRSGLDVIRLIDTTPLPHNGCRRRKKRRV